MSDEYGYGRHGVWAFRYGMSLRCAAWILFESLLLPHPYYSTTD